jgi:hypothetical protein
MTRKRKLDRLFTAYAILNDGRCVTCGARDETLQGGHYIGRTRQSVKWDVLRNCYCQCARCNAIHENNPEILRKVVVQRLGEPGLTTLAADSGNAYTQPDIEAEAARMLREIHGLKRWKTLTVTMKKKIVASDFTNKELVRFIVGY